MRNIYYSIVFILFGLLLLLDYQAGGGGMRFFYGLFLSLGLVKMAAIDIKEFQIPSGIQLYFLGLGIWRMIWDWHNVHRYLLGFLLMGGLLLIIALLSGGKMGGGDIKLMALAGLCLGLRDVFLALAMASIIGSAVGLSFILSGKMRRDEPMAFGPYLGLGIMLAYLYGQMIWNWYWQIS